VEKRSVDLSTRDGTVVFIVLLGGIFAISAIVLAIVLIVTAAIRVAH
jgi:hypothetical protein